MLNNSRPNHNIANGIQQAWSHLQFNFQEVANAAAHDDDSLLVNQPVQQAGFRSNGAIPKSVTREITMEIESARSTYLGKKIINNLDNDDYERWAWEGWNKIGASFATSPPDGIGMIKDTEWRSIIATYLGQPDPNFASLVGRFFGKKGKQLDPFGANLASESLPGGGFRRIHNFVQSLIQSMMKVAGIHSEKEAVNFLLGKVGAPYINNYVDHLSSQAGRRNSPFAIVPDLHVFGYPAGKQTINDSGATDSGEIFCEIKTMQPNKTNYRHNNNSTNKPANRRADKVTSQYRNKFKKLDKEYAPNVVGDGSNNIVGPFEAAQSQFIGGQVIPLIVGAFGDVNTDFENMLRTLAKLAAAGEEGMSISPLRNLDKKGGAFVIMNHQFRRALGVSIVRDMANHKLSRLHYVRATAEDAKYTAEANHSDKRGWNYGSGRSGWYSKHTPGGYANFEQFRNGNFFGTL